MCPLCQEHAPVDPNASPVKCAFNAVGHFTPVNEGCRTLKRLAQLGAESYGGAFANKKPHGYATIGVSAVTHPRRFDAIVLVREVGPNGNNDHFPQALWLRAEPGPLQPLTLEIALTFLNPLSLCQQP